MAHVVVCNRLLIVPIWCLVLWVNFTSKIQEWLLYDKAIPPQQSVLKPGNVVFNKAQFSWNKDPVLTDISLDISPGDFVMVIGPFASGKSTIASAIINEVPITAGSVQTGGTIAYVGQPWIPYGTIRDNILMGRPFDQNFYEQVIQAACLDQDFANFTDGDQTTVNMGGSVLSGGQQQRICIARALYADCDIYVFDDVLSALDVPVAQQIFRQAIIDILRKKTRPSSWFSIKWNFYHIQTKL